MKILSDAQSVAVDDDLLLVEIGTPSVRDSVEPWIFVNVDDRERG